MAKEKSANRRRGYYELAPDQVRALDQVTPGFGATLNDRLKRIGEALEAQSGLRGQVNIASTLSMEQNNIQDVSDPTQPTDAVNFRTLKKWSTCETLTAILEECNDHALLLEDDVDILGAPSVALPFFFGLTVVNPQDHTTGGFTANLIYAFPFTLFHSISVTKIVYEITASAAAGKKLNIGLYNAAKQKLFETGAQAADAAPGVKSFSLTSSAGLNPGSYFLVFTTDGAGTFRALSFATPLEQILNKNANRQGTNDVNSTAAALPSTLGTLTGVVHTAPAVMFEA